MRLTLSSPSTIGLVTAGSSMPLRADSFFALSGQTLAAELIAALLLALVWCLYLWGSVKHRPNSTQALMFHIACLLTVYAVLGPLDSKAEISASAHMIQHMLFILVIAPIWVLSMPSSQFAAVGYDKEKYCGQLLLKIARFPLRLAYLHALVIWFWHIPKFYVLALENPWWHLVEQSCFLLTAALLWWAVLYCSERSRPWAVLALLFTLMNTGFLGAILTFANTLLYNPTHELADQQLAGLLMWVPGGMPYLLATAWLGYCWLNGVNRNEELQ